MKKTKDHACWHCTNYKWKRRFTQGWSYCKAFSDWFKPGWDFGKINKCDKFE